MMRGQKLLLPVLTVINQVERFEKPTWRRLVETVKDEVGGNNPVLAQTIARQHPGAPGNRVYSHYSFGAAIIAMWRLAGIS